MRDLLTWLGLALLAVLAALAAAPLLVDFDAYRGRIAEEISSITGAQAQIGGPVTLRLLPSPALTAESLALTGASGALRAKKADMRLSLPGLMQGRLQFTLLRLEGAEITLETTAPLRPAGAWQCDQCILHEAKLIVARYGAALATLEHLDLDAEILAPQGPFRAKGAFGPPNARVTVALAAEEATKGALPLKIALGLPDKSKLDLDGALALDSLTYAASAKMTGQAPPGGWQAEARFLASPDGVKLDDLSVHLDDGPLANRVTGHLAWNAAAKSGLAEFSTQNLGAGWSAALVAALDGEAPALPFDLRVSVDQLVWRGVTWSHFKLNRPAQGAASVAAQGPGGAALTASLDGKDRRQVTFSATNFAAFAAAAPELAPLAASSLRQVSLGGDFARIDGEWRLSNGAFTLAQIRGRCELAFRPATAQAPARFSAQISAQAPDLAALETLAAPPLGDGDLDLTLTLRIGAGLRTSGAIDLKLARENGQTRLETLALHNIGGAEFTASGHWGAQFAGLKGEAQLKAEDLSELARLLARLAPGAATKALATRAKILSPADVFARIDLEGGTEIAGGLGATWLTALSMPMSDGGRSAMLDVTAGDSRLLLALLGAPSLDAAKKTPVHLAVSARAPPGADALYALSAHLDMGGLSGVFGGRWQGGKLGGDVTLAGDPLALSDFFGPGPIRIGAHVEQTGDGLSLRQLAGQWGDARFSGDLAWGANGFSGALNADRFSLPALAALILGPPAPAKAGALWPSLSFAPVVDDPPRARLAVTTQSLAPFDTPARFDLVLAPGALSLQKVEFFGGALRGEAELRREAGHVTLSGVAEAKSLTLQNAGFSALLDGHMSFAGSGVSMAALAGSLAGGGGAHVRELVLQGAAPDGVDAALAASEASDAPFDIEATTRALDQALAKAPLRLPDANFALRLADGLMSLTQGANAFAFDLRDGSWSLTAGVSATQRLKDGPPPRADVVWSGPWSAPTRRIEATAYVSAVAARALAREQARIEKQKAEDRERAKQANPAR